ncbi:MAG: hypothetical protein R2822_07830 [Spirosomataceae bacterium]
MGVLIDRCGLTGRILGGNWRISVGCCIRALLVFVLVFFGDAITSQRYCLFAAGYIVTLCFLLKYLQELPTPTWKNWLLLIATGIGIGLGSRAPG